MAKIEKKEEVLENVAPEITEEAKKEEIISTEEKVETKTEENSENLEKTQEIEENGDKNNDEIQKDDKTQAEEKNDDLNANKSENEENIEKKEESEEKTQKIDSIRAKLLCNCKYWRIWQVVEMSKDVFNAFWEWYVEETTDELTNKNRAVIIEKSKAEKQEEEKQRIAQRQKAMDERKKNFWTISKSWQK